jgi:hypothetical protein
VNFPSTILPQTNDPQEIQKAVLDLLDKINKIGGTPGAVSVNPVADTAANFTSKNPTLLSGQMGYETDTKFFKIGDGTTAWTSLSYQPKFGTIAPLPQMAAGAGKVTVQGSTVGAWILPAGGTWWWFGIDMNIGASNYTAEGGIAAGGTTVMTGYGGTGYVMGWAWRIA